MKTQLCLLWSFFRQNYTHALVQVFAIIPDAFSYKIGSINWKSIRQIIFFSYSVSGYDNALTAVWLSAEISCVYKGLMFHVLLMRAVVKNWRIWSRSIFSLRPSQYIHWFQGYGAKLEHLPLHHVISETQNKYQEIIRHTGHVPYNKHSSSYISLHRWTAVKHAASPRWVGNYKQNFNSQGTNTLQLYNQSHSN